MVFDIKKYETLLNDTTHVLSCIDSIDPTMTPKDVSHVRHSNHCLLWLYTTHLKGKYSPVEIDSVLGLVKTVLIPRLRSLSSPHRLSYVELSGILSKVLGTIY
jgi:hypothetical protein